VTPGTNQIASSNLSFELWKTVITVAITLIGSAFLKYVIRWFRYRKPIRTYKCAEENPTGFEFGFMKHSYGESTTDVKSNSTVVWKHTIDRIDGGACTLYGPYSADFGEPGKYTITFRIKVCGVDEFDLDLLHIEVARCHFQMVTRNGNPNFEHTHQSPIKRSSFSGKDLFKMNGEYRDFELDCYIPSDGIFEYRAWITNVFDPEKHTFYFDEVRVCRSHKFIEIIFDK